MKVTKQAYRAGREDFLHLIEAERLLLELQLTHERAAVDREIAIAQIETLVGPALDGAEPLTASIHETN